MKIKLSRAQMKKRYVEMQNTLGEALAALQAAQSQLAQIQHAQNGLIVQPSLQQIAEVNT